MNYFKFFICAIVISGVLACSKEDALNGSLQNESSTFNDQNIVCIDGTLHFPNAEICLSTMETLTTEANLHAFEKAHNFFSWRSFTDSMLDDIIECDTPEEYQAVLETCSGYLKEDSGRLMPVIESVGYASIADINGVFYIGNIKHVVNEETISIEMTDAKTRAVAVNELEYVVPIQGDVETRDVSLKYTDYRRETNKYKVFARTNVLRHTVVEQVNGKNLYNTSFAVQIHVSGQKKKTLIGWNTYKDRFYVENLHWDLTIAGKNISFLNYRNDFSATEYTKNFYVTVPFGTGQFIHTPTEVPMPPKFRCIVHRARSRSMGNCGALTDINYCMPLVMLPISECI
ncbi:hypothetical protein [uncultured Bacteroides sp.]|uniref:hypothetical protein n=1 Tax=uncultured Bacteroides sp. TaxID=162156 RepID=UPI00261FE8CC|nr:hypothetical protein [uncultured Bacteroides sp.]